MKCNKCGSEIPDNVLYCPTCGEKVNQGNKNETPEEKDEISCDISISNDSHKPSFIPALAEEKSKKVAALLAIFLGFIGSHNFYLGYKGRGTAQLILTIFIVGAPIAFLWSFIEFILILCGVLKDSDGRDLY